MVDRAHGRLGEWSLCAGFVGIQTCARIFATTANCGANSHRSSSRALRGMVQLAFARDAGSGSPDAENDRGPRGCPRAYGRLRPLELTCSFAPRDDRIAVQLQSLSLKTSHHLSLLCLDGSPAVWFYEERTRASDCSFNDAPGVLKPVIRSDSAVMQILIATSRAKEDVRFAATRS